MKRHATGANRGRQLLAVWMKANGATTTRVGADLGLASCTVYLWLHGRHRPAVQVWPRIENMTNGAVPTLAWTQPEEMDSTTVE